METGDNLGNERRRILDMVESGAVSPEEADRLLASLEQRSSSRQRCPYCAEEIPAAVELCPECNTPLGTSPSTGSTHGNGAGFHALTGLGKFLVCYLFLVCGLVWLLNLGHFGPGVAPSVLLATLGIVAGVMICKGSDTGWVLGALWAGIQIIPIIAGGILLNRQILHVGFIQYSGGGGVGINFIGIALLIMFLKAKPRSSASLNSRGEPS